MCCYQDIDDSTGIFRPEGSSAMDEAKAYLIAEMRQAKLSVTCDRVGNLYGRRAGTAGARAVLSGSHVDTVKNGGQLDGVFGVVAALEALRRLRDEGFANERSIDMIVFMGEEGSFFSEALLGSDVLSGNMTVEAARNLQGADGRSLGQILDAACTGEIRNVSLDDYEYFIETHIEQGPVLWNNKETIGCVTAIVGLYHLWIEFESCENHAGSTPMYLRQNPQIPAAELTIYLNDLAVRRAKVNPSVVATVDTWNMYPNAPSVIPGKVRLTVDIRAASETDILYIRDSIVEQAELLKRKYEVGMKWGMLMEHKPCSLNSDVAAAIEKAARKNRQEPRRITSGAVHDALNIAQKIKTGMIFVPSRKGISHSPYEWTDWEDLEVGIAVLTDTIKDLSIT
ncbi:MAG: hydantoinase/carbamoylase family amidase [Treponema sp.]|nr:hydantoinase/carbamoylase family amidase [Treponema sp.]